MKTITALLLFCFVCSPALAGSKVLYVHPITGEQIIADLGPGGKVVDGTVLWDEAADGPLPGNVDVGAMSRVGNSLVVDSAKKAARDAAVAAKNAEAGRKNGVRTARVQRLVVLAKKAKDGSISPAERNEAIGLAILEIVKAADDTVD